MKKIAILLITLSVIGAGLLSGCEQIGPKTDKDRFVGTWHNQLDSTITEEFLSDGRSRWGETGWGTYEVKDGKLYLHYFYVIDVTAIYSYSFSNEDTTITLTDTNLFPGTIITLKKVSGDESNPYTPPIPIDTTHNITYRITGTATSVSVTYENENGGTSQISKVYLPWEYNLYGMKAGDFVYISAQNNGEHGTVTVEILLDGWWPVKSSTSEGAYVIATASGML